MIAAGLLVIRKTDGGEKLTPQRWRWSIATRPAGRQTAVEFRKARTVMLPRRTRRHCSFPIPQWNRRTD
jgi:hypothetical protein